MKEADMLDKYTRHIDNIRKAYDQSVADYNCGIDEESYLPKSFMETEKYFEFKKIANTCNSGDPKIKDFLKPTKGQRFLDVGSSLNAISYGLFEWNSIYYGVDISSKLVDITNNFALKHKIKLGSIRQAQADNLPFENSLFDIVAIIGVLEYYNIEYVKLVLQEVFRVSKKNAKLVVDYPNMKHPLIDIMFEYERYLGRDRPILASNRVFEKTLENFFEILEFDDTNLMITYFAVLKG